MILGHGDVAPKSHVSFFRRYLTDLIDAVQQAAADGATVADSGRMMLVPGRPARQRHPERIIEAACSARDQWQADVIVFPELTLCGYPPEDLLLRSSMQRRIEQAAFVA